MSSSDDDLPDLDGLSDGLQHGSPCRDGHHWTMNMLYCLSKETELCLGAGMEAGPCLGADMEAGPCLGVGKEAGPCWRTSAEGVRSKKSEFYSDSSDVEESPLVKRLGLMLDVAAAQWSEGNNAPQTSASTAAVLSKFTGFKMHQSYITAGRADADGLASLVSDDLLASIQTNLEPEPVNSPLVAQSYEHSNQKLCLLRDATQYETVPSIGTSASKQSERGMGSLTDKQIEREKKRAMQEALKTEKERAKAEKAKLKAEAEEEKGRRRLLAEAVRDSKPGECIKHLTVVLDGALLILSFGPVLVATLQAAGVRYEVTGGAGGHGGLPIPNCISFWRSVLTQSTVGQGERREVLEKEMLIVLPIAKFLQLIHSSHGDGRREDMDEVSGLTLDVWIESTRCALGTDCSLTVIVQGVEQHLRQRAVEAQRSHRWKVHAQLGSDAPSAPTDPPTKRRRKGVDAAPTPPVTRLMIEEALLGIQLGSSGRTHVQLVETDAELAKLVLHYSKAVAETPYKRARLQTGFSLFMEGGRGVKVGKEGQGSAAVWREQLMTFKGVGTELANSILALYPSPRLLLEAYKACATQKQAELLLQDIEVRRGAGILSTVRKIGKELSRRVYELMTSRDANHVIR